MSAGPLHRWLPDSLFARLLGLLLVMALLSHVLALGLVFEWMGPPGPPPGGPPGARPPPGPPGPWWGMAADVAVRLLAMVLAAWWGARWLAQPVNRLAQAATQWSQRLQGAALAADGPAELRKATQAFNEMQAQIRQHLSDRDRFVAAVSHDLRTPLTRLRLRAECLTDDAERMRFGRDIAEMDDMIRATLDHLGGGDQAEPFVSVDMAALVQSLVDNETDAGHPVGLLQLPPHGGAVVCGRVVSLKRCVANLVGNALRYGQGTEVGVAVVDGMVQVTVADRGPGLPEHELDKVKLPFYRAEASRNRHTGGVGLGLSIAQDIALAHQGHLALSNRPEGGLCAVLRVPLASGMAGQAVRSVA